MSKREKLINRWVDIVNCVFFAENKLYPEWEEKLKAARGTKDSQKVADDYVLAIAIEIVDKAEQHEKNK